jgi:3-oxocholest-4-en-26-oate---CoA ligase
MASCKAPRQVLIVDTVGWAPNGKVDYRRLKAYAVETVAAAASRS